MMMTSKDKLIEFLKSSKIDYEHYPHNRKWFVDMEYIIFVFDAEGNYLYQENY